MELATRGRRGDTHPCCASKSPQFSPSSAEQLSVILQAQLRDHLSVASPDPREEVSLPRAPQLVAVSDDKLLQDRGCELVRNSRRQMGESRLSWLKGEGRKLPKGLVGSPRIPGRKARSPEQLEWDLELALRDAIPYSSLP